MICELGGQSVTLISDHDGVHHFAFKCEDHDIDGMAECPVCFSAMKSVAELKHLRGGLPTFSGEHVAAFYEGWQNVA